jgi:LysR family transcriptional regulator, nitrogen assimilation regulatory protein
LTPLAEPRIARTIVLALPGSRVVGAPVRRTVELFVECVEHAVRSGKWLEATWIAD